MKSTRALWLTALLLVAAAIYLLLWALSAAKLRFMSCPEGYSWFATEPDCRAPAILETLSLVIFVCSLAVLYVARRRARRAKQRLPSPEVLPWP